MENNAKNGENHYPPPWHTGTQYNPLSPGQLMATVQKKASRSLAEAENWMLTKQKVSDRQQWKQLWFSCDRGTCYERLLKRLARLTGLSPYP